MLKIRFQRVGRRHEPIFRLVLVDSHSGPKSGKVKEILGSYDSRRGEKAEIKADRVKYWMGLGAQTSGTVHNILVSKKIIEGKKVNVLPKKKPIVKEKSEEETKKEAAETSEIKKEEKTDTPEEASKVTDEEVKVETDNKETGNKTEEKVPEENQTPETSNEEPKEETKKLDSEPVEATTSETGEEKNK